MKQFALLFFLAIVFTSFILPQSKKATKAKTSTSARKETAVATATHRITFVELGSVNCIPCRAMQPVMKSVEQKYGGQVKVLFYDVWKEEQAHYAQQYGIRVIPTQVFLDEAGKELMRHEGFFPENQIDAFLQTKGLAPSPSVKD